MHEENVKKFILYEGAGKDTLENLKLADAFKVEKQ